MKRIIVTGAAGFAGSHLVDLLLRERQGEIEAIDRLPASPIPTNLQSVFSEIHYHAADIGQYDGFAALIKEIEPDEVYHLAGQPYIPGYEADWSESIVSTLRSTFALFEACATLRRKPRILLVSSADVYGAAFTEVEHHVSEAEIPEPITPYGAVKLSLEQFAKAYYNRRGLETVLVRPFNHIGPRQSPSFVSASVAKQIVDIERGQQSPALRLGNIDPQRDFTDVRDMVRAYLLAMTHCDPGVPFNVCSGNIISIRELVELFRDVSGVSFEVISDPQFQRSKEVQLMAGDCRRFHARTGWQPQYTLRETISDIIHYWRSMIA